VNTPRGKGSQGGKDNSTLRSDGTLDKGKRMYRLPGYKKGCPVKKKGRRKKKQVMNPRDINET